MATRIAKAEFTRPADTTAYSAGDVISNSTTAGAAMLFSGATGGPRGGGFIRKVLIFKSGNAIALSTTNLYLFNADPGVVNDNGSFVNVFTLRDSITEAISMPIFAFMGGGGALTSVSPGSGWTPILGGSTSGDIYGVLGAIGAYVPSSAEIFTVRLFIETP